MRTCMCLTSIFRVERRSSAVRSTSYYEVYSQFCTDVNSVTGIIAQFKNIAERALRLFQWEITTIWVWTVHCPIGYRLKIASLRHCIKKRPQTELCAPMGISILLANSCTRWRGIFKGLSHDGGPTDFSENLRALLFNDYPIEWTYVQSDPSRTTLPLTYGIVSVFYVSNLKLKKKKVNFLNFLTFLCISFRAL
jgi:hypothetical protein